MSMTATLMHTCTRCRRHDWRDGCTLTACALWTWRTTHTPLETPERGLGAHERQSMTQDKQIAFSERSKHLPLASKCPVKTHT